MITLSFSRFGDGVYISHTDVLRALNRTMRRAGIDINYSRGYNKHMALKMSQPLPLGIESKDEWVTCDVAAEISKEEFFERFKENCPPFLSPNRVFETENNPSLAGKIIASRYIIKCAVMPEIKCEIEKLKDGFSIKTVKNGEETVKDYTGYVYSIEVKDGEIECVFAYGNKNLRADTFIDFLNEKFSLGISLYDVCRTEQLVEENGRLLSAAEYMEKLV